MKTTRANARPQTRTGRILSNAVRIALISGIVWFGWSSAQALTTLLSGRKPVQQPAAGPQQQLPPSPVTVPGRGYWSFAGLPLNVEVRQVSAAKLAAALSEAPGAATRDEDAADEPQLLSFLTRMAATVEHRETLDVYISDQPSLKLRVYVGTSGGRTQFRGGYLAYPRGTDNWTILAGTPDRSATMKNVPQPSLLPLPPGATRACSRYDLAHRLQCEFVTCPGESDALHSLWTAQGWKVQRAPWSGGDQIVVLCTRGDDTVQVTALPGVQGDELILMLLKLTPDEM